MSGSAPFVHLHVHTSYSLCEGALRIEDAIAAAARFDMPAIAITDTNAMYGVVAFYRCARAAGIRPILGAQLAVATTTSALQGGDERGRSGQQSPLDTAVFLAESLTGYRNLVQLVTIAQQRTGRPSVTFAELGQAASGLIALVGGGESLLLRLFSADRQSEASALLDAWQTVWPQSQLYIDVQDHQLPSERAGLPGLVRAARQRTLPLLATNDAHYLQRADADAQRILSQIESGSGSETLSGDRYELACAEEMASRFSKLPEALVNTLRVAERCQVDLPQGKLLMPAYPTAAGHTSEQVLRTAAAVGVRQRYAIVTDAVTQRLDYELDIICRLGFADYFLVVADFIRFAHRQGISTGPGRGSAAGSVVAYALRITDVDPIRYGLLFERFLNPERVTWPDIDTDFEFERRPEVIRYVASRYGAQHVAQIGTFGTLAARAALRDAGRVSGTDAKLVDKMAKLIPATPGVTLVQAEEQVPSLAELVTSVPAAASLWRHARSIEGFPRHTSVHAAGVVISPVPLTTLTPVQPGVDGTVVTQYAMESVEYLGLMKMDFLGLRTLTLIDACVASVARRSGTAWNWARVADDDAATFAMLARGETDGCFQLESNGVRRMLREMKPTRFEDMIAVISLYRPGPMENIPTFLAAKSGRTAVQYLHPDLEPILKDTYGVIVYQEQIMQIASRIAGFSLGQADLLRRAVSKKKREVLDAERVRFVDGCLARGYERAMADDVYDLIVRFANYGFPRSHAAAYAILAYRTAYLRAHYLTDFLAALLSMTLGSADKVQIYEADAKRHGLTVLPPSVVWSDGAYTAVDDNEIRSGLLSIRGVGRGAVTAIVAARHEAPFQSLVDFIRRVNPRPCNRKAMESLLLAGALVDFLPDGASSAVALQLLDEAYAEAGFGGTGRGASARVGATEWKSPGLGLFSEPTERPAEVASRSRSPAATDGERTAQALYIQVGDGTDVVDLKAVLAAYPGDLPVALWDGKKRLRLLDDCSVSVQPELVSQLEERVGIGHARVGRLPATPARGRSRH